MRRSIHHQTGRGRCSGGGDLPEGWVSQATFFNWRKKYADLTPSEVRRLRELEAENTRLKKIVADLSRDKEMLLGKSSSEALKPARERELVDEMRSE